jgi:hypothetical protein
MNNNKNIYYKHVVRTTYSEILTLLERGLRKMTSLINKAKVLLRRDRRTRDIFLDNLWKSRKEQKEQVPETSPVTPTPDVTVAMRERLSKLYVKQLQQIAEILGIVIPNRCNKTQLVDLIIKELCNN